MNLFLIMFATLPAFLEPVELEGCTAEEYAQYESLGFDPYECDGDKASRDSVFCPDGSEPDEYAPDAGRDECTGELTEEND